MNIVKFYSPYSFPVDAPYFPGSNPRFRPKRPNPLYLLLEFCCFFLSNYKNENSPLHLFSKDSGSGIFGNFFVKQSISDSFLVFLQFRKFNFLLANFKFFIIKALFITQTKRGFFLFRKLI